MLDKNKASEIYGIKGVKYKVDNRYYNADWHEMIRMEGENWVTKTKALEIQRERENEQDKESLEIRIKKQQVNRRNNEIRVQSVIDLKREIDKIQGDIIYMINSTKVLIGDLSVFKKEMEGAFDSLKDIKTL